MKAFFTGSPRALKDHSKEHKLIFDAISQCGFDHLSDLVVSADPVEFYEKSRQEVLDHYKDTIQCLKNADVIVAEVSLHSMSMGFLVEKALGMGKPVIVLHMDDLAPFFFAGIYNEKLQIVSYNDSNIFNVVRRALDYAVAQQDVRFDFFVSPKINSHLDQVSRTRRIPKSVYVRGLIEEDMGGGG